MRAVMLVLLMLAATQSSKEPSPSAMQLALQAATEAAGKAAQAAAAAAKSAEDNSSSGEPWAVGGLGTILFIGWRFAKPWLEAWDTNVKRRYLDPETEAKNGTRQAIQDIAKHDIRREEREERMLEMLASISESQKLLAAEFRHHGDTLTRIESAANKAARNG